MDTLADTLWQEFAVETEEHLQAVEPILAQADPQQANAGDIAQLFRSFHSIKGLARAMDVLSMEGIAHHAENLLGLVREGRTALTADVADLLLQSVDALKRMRDVVAEQRHDAPPDPGLIARLAEVFAQCGGVAEGPVTEAPASTSPGEDATLHEDPEMLGIFVEMLKARGAELCAALSADPAERALAAEAAETLGHAAEVMEFEALAAGLGGLQDSLRHLPPQAAGAGDPARQDFLSQLGAIRLQIELLAEICGQDAGAAEFSAALAEKIGDEPQRIAASLGELNRHLREHLADGDHLAAEADAAAIARAARTLRTALLGLSMARAAELALLVEELYGRVATGEIEVPEPLIDAADQLYGRLAETAGPGAAADLAEDEAAAFTAELRAPLITTAQKAMEGETEARLVAGLRLPPELLAVLSNENLAALEAGLAQGLHPYQILLHLEADQGVAERLMAWLSAEARPITNRTIVTEGESWFEFLVLSPLDPEALSGRLRSLDPQQRCVKRIQRVSDTRDAELAPAAAPTRPADAGAPAPGRAAMATNMIRVRGEVVDAFLDELGEMRAMVGTLSHVIRGVGERALVGRARAFAERLSGEQRAEFVAMFQDFRDRDRRLMESEEQISRVLSRLHQAALELRVVPVDVVFNRLPRLVRDLAQRQGKSVELTLEGRDVRIDKSMVEALADPLIHMVRNAVDHGIEMPQERRAAGKPERAQLTLRAAQRGSEIHIEVADDGRGLDADAIRAKAVARGLITRQAAAALPDSEVFQFIFEAGLSTAQMVTETSGRGVGMDIVLSTVHRLNGDIATRSTRGKGTSFTLSLPISAALQTALIVRVGEQSLAIPERHVMSVAEIETGDIHLVGVHRSILHRQAVLPLYDLGHLLGMSTSGERASVAYQPIVVTTNGRHMVGLEVDAVERRQELFLKDLDPRLARFPGIGGASVLGDGRVVLVLDGDELIQLAARGIERGTPAAASRLAS